MPNWVFNRVSLRGDADTLAKVKEQLNKPYSYEMFNSLTKTMNRMEVNEPVFAFWNVIAPDDLSAYAGGEDDDRVLPYWYTWNNSNWNTKWGAADPSVRYTVESALISYNELTYEFNTAWDAPHPVIRALAEQYPTLEIRFYYEEEQGWGGEYATKGGEMLWQNEWDIPNSHADFEGLGRECNCDTLYDEPDYWFEDCPIDTDTYQWIDGSWTIK
jgi:hypothetical protein